MFGSPERDRLYPGTGTPFSPRLCVLILGVAGFISAADNWFVSPALPAIASDLGASIPDAGLILASYFLPYGCMQPVFGLLSDRVGKIQVLACILAGFTVGSGACTLAGTLPSLVIWRGVTGFFAAGIIALSLAYLGDTIPEPLRKQYVGTFMGIVFLGQGLSVGIGGFLAEFYSWRVAFLLFAGIAACDLVLLRMLPGSKPSGEGVPVRTELGEIYHHPASWQLFPLAGAVGFLLIGIYSYLGAYLHQVIGLDYLEIGMTVMFFGFSALLGGLGAGYLTTLLGSRGMVSGGAGVALVSVLLLVLIPDRLTGLIASAGIGFGYISIQSTVATLAFDIAPRSKGLPSALVGLGLFGGAGIGTACMGSAIGAGGYIGAFLVYALGIALIVLLPCLISVWKKASCR